MLLKIHFFSIFFSRSNITFVDAENCTYIISYKQGEYFIQIYKHLWNNKVERSCNITRKFLAHSFFKMQRALKELKEIVC